MKKKIMVGVLIIIGLIWNVKFGEATITVSGTQSGTWLLTNSPYIVTGTVTVESGTTLIIESGVIVKFATNTSLINYGTLLAIGTPDGTITFTSNKSILSPGDWNSIKFSGASAKGTISYCKIRYAKQSVYIENATGIVITHNYIHDNKGDDGLSGNSGQPGEVGAGIYLYASTNNIITQNIIWNNQGGVGGFAGNYGLGGTGGIGVGIFLFSSSNNDIATNTIYSNQGASGGNVSHQGSGGEGGNGVGVYLSSSGTNTIRSNVIYNNQGGEGGSSDSVSSGGKGGMGIGIYLESSINNIITLNTISINQGGEGGQGGSNGASGNAYGIYIDSNSLNNTIDPSNTYNNEPIHYYYGMSGVSIRNETLIGSSTTNIGKIVLINCTDFIIQNNIISNSKGENGASELEYTPGESGKIGVGIYILSSSNNTIKSNIIRNIQGGQGGGGGFNSSGGEGGIGAGIYLSSYSKNNTVENNTIYNIQGGRGGGGTSYGSGGKGGIGVGIYLCLHSNTNIIRGNILLDNIGGKGGRVYEMGSGGEGGIGTGIYLFSSASNNIGSNTIYNNQGGQGGSGGYGILEGRGGMGIGIYLVSNNNNITNSNTIRDNQGGPGNPNGDGIGIYCKSSVISNLIYNNIYNNQTYNIQTDGTQTAKYNWWGGDPPATYTFSGNIDYEPWLKGTYTGAKITLVSPSSGTIGVIVTIEGMGYDPTETIRINFGTTMSITTTTTNVYGIFSTIFTVNIQRYGTVSITATGLKSLISKEDLFNLISATRLEIEPESKIVTKWDEFGLDIWLKDVVNLAGLDVFLDFDHNRLEVLDDNPAEEGIQ
ncbi:MAG: right-handed parallel beta-helix repeat-containing protein, partial [bacterium]